jgi:hypothetical protein
VGGEGTVYHISPESAFDDPERVVMLVVHEKDGQIRTDCKPEALKAKEEEKATSRGSYISLSENGYPPERTYI